MTTRALIVIILLIAAFGLSASAQTSEPDLPTEPFKLRIYRTETWFQIRIVYEGNSSIDLTNLGLRMSSNEGPLIELSGDETFRFRLSSVSETICLGIVPTGGTETPWVDNCGDMGTEVSTPGTELTVDYPDPFWYDNTNRAQRFKLIIAYLGTKQLFPDCRAESLVTLCEISYIPPSSTLTDAPTFTHTLDVTETPSPTPTPDSECLRPATIRLEGTVNVTRDIFANPVTFECFQEFLAESYDQTYRYAGAAWALDPADYVEGASDQAGTLRTIQTGIESFFGDGASVTAEANASGAVIGISWYEAEAYCRWFSFKTGQRASLPTRDEWDALNITAGDLEWLVPRDHTASSDFGAEHYAVANPSVIDGVGPSIWVTSDKIFTPGVIFRCAIAQ